MKPAQFNEQKPVARIVEHGATVKLEWASVDAAHNAKAGNLYPTLPQRTWVGLTESDRRLINFQWQEGNGTASEITDLVESKLRELNEVK